MKTKYILFALFVINFGLLTLKSFSSTPVSSGTVSGHWTLAGSPYLIQGSIYIPQDSILLIDPGVTVNFQTSFTPYLLVQGQLLAMGAV